MGVGPIFEGTLRQHDTVRLVSFASTPPICGAYVVMGKEARELPTVDAFMQIVQS